MAQKTSRLTVQDLIDANKLVDYVKKNIEGGLYFRKHAVGVRSACALAYGDSSFANMQGEKSQAGTVRCLANVPEEVVNGHFDRQVPLVWASFRVNAVQSGGGGLQY